MKGYPAVRPEVGTIPIAWGQIVGDPTRGESEAHEEMALESVRVPEVGESVSEGTIATWFIEPGTAVTAGQPLFELATEKVDSEVPSPLSGTVVELLVPTGGAVAVGDVVLTLETAGDVAGDAPVRPSAEQDSPEKAEPTKRSRRERRRSQGPSLDGAPPLPPMPGGAIRTATPSATFATPGEGDTFVEFSRVRSVTGRIVSEANQTIPHVLSMVEVDHTAVFQARDVIEQRGDRAPTALAYVAVAVARALKDHPVLNSSVGDGGLVLHSQINLSFAVATPDGLVAPVVKRADQLTVEGMATAIVDLARRARAKQLAPDDMTGGTFSISNNGSVGSVLTTPVITPPQVAVLSTDKVVDRAVVIEQNGTKSIAIRPIGNLAMCWDHRAMDGADAAQFLVAVKDILETTKWTNVG